MVDTDLVDLQISVGPASFVFLGLYLFGPPLTLALLYRVSLAERPAFFTIRFAHVFASVAAPFKKTVKQELNRDKQKCTCPVVVVAYSMPGVFEIICRCSAALIKGLNLKICKVCVAVLN